MDNTILDFVENFMEKNKDYLENIDYSLKSEIKNFSKYSLTKPVSYALESGKRIRPLILLISCDALGGSKSNAYPCAVAVELLHTESIIHDDIIDQDVHRRGKDAFHVKYGYNTSILTADFVFGLILSISSNYNDKFISKCISDAALKMCEGEWSELKIDPEIYQMNWNEYISIVSNKTATLFETAAKLGAYLAKGNTKEIEALSNFGLNLGIAYQIQDDILDIKDKHKIVTALSIDGQDVISHLSSMSQNYAELAKNELSILEDSKYKDLLVELTEFTIIRPY